MNAAPSHTGREGDAGSAAGERLESWKEIAVYLKRSVRTLHRWEKEEGLPIHRQLHKDLGSVFAYKNELDTWALGRSLRTALQGHIQERASSLMTIAVTVAAAAVVIGSGLYVIGRRAAPATSGPDAPVHSLELISTFSGSHRWPTLSPDGRTLAFVSDAGGIPQVWIKQLGKGEPVQVTFGDIPAARPRWSAQGDRIVYSRAGSGIWSLPSLGGDARQIIENGWNADLSPDGERLVFERGGQIFIAGADGSGANRLPHLPQRLIAYYGDAWPTFSPDGSSIAVFLGEEGRYGDYWLLPSDGGPPRRVTSDFQEGGAPAWTPDGKSLIIRSARAGGPNLWRVSVAGGTPEPLTTGAGDDFDPVVSPDGRTLLFANVKRTWTLVVQNVRSGQRRTLIEQRTPLVFPRYSPDGRRIALQTMNSRGDMQLLVMDADGSNVTAVTDGVGDLNIMPQWSADGETLYFYQVRPTRTFRRVSVSGGAPRAIAPWYFGRHYQAAVDPRDRMIVYSLVENGRLQQSRARDLETHAETTLPFALYEQRFSRDGRLIAGESRDHEVVVCELTGRCQALTPKSDRRVTALAWSSDAGRVFFLRHTTPREWAELTSVDVHGGAEAVQGLVGPFERDFVIFMDMSPRDEIVYVTHRERPHELWLANLR